MYPVIIPARGGSKGIPKKNIIDLNGKPLLAYAVEAALESSIVSEVIVSTDDTEIGQVALDYGARPIRRPAEISGNTDSSELALLHALAQLDYVPEMFAFVQCTNPFILPSDISGCFAHMETAGVDCSFTAVPFHHFLWDRSGNGINHYAHERRKMRQEFNTNLMETGSVYTMRTKGFLEEKHRFFGKIRPYIIARPVIEIDNPAELRLARTLLKGMEDDEDA